MRSMASSISPTNLAVSVIILTFLLLAIPCMSSAASSELIPSDISMKS